MANDPSEQRGPVFEASAEDEETYRALHASERHLIQIVSPGAHPRVLAHRNAIEISAGLFLAAKMKPLAHGGIWRTYTFLRDFIAADRALQKGWSEIPEWLRLVGRECIEWVEGVASGRFALRGDHAVRTALEEFSRRLREGERVRLPLLAGPRACSRVRTLLCTRLVSSTNDVEVHVLPIALCAVGEMVLLLNSFFGKSGRALWDLESRSGQTILLCKRRMLRDAQILLAEELFGMGGLQDEGLYCGYAQVFAAVVDARFGEVRSAAFQILLRWLGVRVRGAEFPREIEPSGVLSLLRRVCPRDPRRGRTQLGRALAVYFAPFSRTRAFAASTFRSMREILRRPALLARYPALGNACMLVAHRLGSEGAREAGIPGGAQCLTEIYACVRHAETPSWLAAELFFGLRLDASEGREPFYSLGDPSGWGKPARVEPIEEIALWRASAKQPEKPPQSAVPMGLAQHFLDVCFFAEQGASGVLESAVGPALRAEEVLRRSKIHWELPVSPSKRTRLTILPAPPPGDERDEDFLRCLLTRRVREVAPIADMRVAQEFENPQALFDLSAWLFAELDFRLR